MEDVGARVGKSGQGGNGMEDGDGMYNNEAPQNFDTYSKKKGTRSERTRPFTMEGT